jgi:hypothetical protein
MQRDSSTSYLVRIRGFGISAPVGQVSAQRPQETHGDSFKLMSSGVVTSVSNPVRMKS